MVVVGAAGQWAPWGWRGNPTRHATRKAPMHPWLPLLLLQVVPCRQLKASRAEAPRLACRTRGGQHVGAHRLLLLLLLLLLLPACGRGGHGGDCRGRGGGKHKWALRVAPCPLLLLLLLLLGWRPS